MRTRSLQEQREALEAPSALARDRRPYIRLNPLRLAAELESMRSLVPINVVTDGELVLHEMPRAGRSSAKAGKTRNGHAAVYQSFAREVLEQRIGVDAGIAVL